MHSVYFSSAFYTSIFAFMEFRPNDDNYYNIVQEKVSQSNL
jgi:hypothetical protein